MYCPNCKADFDGKFCPECGAKVVEMPASKNNKNDNAESYFQTAEDYCYGQNGKEEDEKSAAEWYLKAAELGHIEALYCLGRLFYSKGGIEEGVGCYQQAAEQGHAAAQYELAVAYSIGMGVEQSDDESMKWYRKAAQQGHEQAIDFLKEVGERGPSPITKKKSVATTKPVATTKGTTASKSVNTAKPTAEPKKSVATTKPTKPTTEPKATPVPKILTKDNVRACAHGINSFSGIDLHINEGVEEIADEVFKDCRQFCKVVFPKSLKKIGNSAFKNCGFKSIDIPEDANLETIGDGAFECEKSAIGNSEGFYFYLPKSLKYVGDNAFSRLRIKRIYIPEDGNLETIGFGAFYSCCMDGSLDIPDSVKSIGDYAFAYNSFNRLYIDAAIEKIGDGAFEGCSELEDLDLDSYMNKVKKIGNSTFQYCESLERVIFSETLNYIGYNAFTDCEKLKEIEFLGKKIEIEDDAFEGCCNVESILVPEGCIGYYRNILPAEYWPYITEY